MKGIKIEPNAKHVIIVEEGDRLFSLVGNQSAVILGADKDDSEDIKVTSIFPEDLEEKEIIPFSVTLAACVREFLEDSEWVMAARQRIAEKEANKQA